MKSCLLLFNENLGVKLHWIPFFGHVVLKFCLSYLEIEVLAMVYHGILIFRPLSVEILFPGLSTLERYPY